MYWLILVNLFIDVVINDSLGGQQGCDVEESPLGNTYFRKITPWGQKLDLPCPTGQLFVTSSCSCEKKRCTSIDTDPGSYMEYIDLIGDWVTGRCPDGMEYRTDFCMCSKKNFIPTTTMSPTTVRPEDCPYRQIGPSAYQEYFHSIQDWVTNYCPLGSLYVPEYCQCIYQGATTSFRTEQRTVPATIKPTLQPPANCPFIPDGKSSFKEYIQSLGDWLTYHCSAGQIFSTTWCTCVVEGQIPEFTHQNPGLVSDCPFQPSGLTGYMEYIVELGVWVTSNCPAGLVYSQSHCTCISKDLVQVTPSNAVPTSSTPAVTNPNCDLRPVDKSSYQKYEDSIKDWVTISCHAGMVFNIILCHCIQEGVVVTGRPGSTTESHGVTHPNCPYVSVGQRSYKEYIPDIGDWVTNDCPSDMVFDVAMCSCHPDGSAEIIVIPITTIAPLTIPTVPNCPHKKSDDGYLEFIPDMNIWINNACPVYYEFVEQYCKCLSKSDRNKIPTTQPTTRLTPSSPLSTKQTGQSDSTTHAHVPVTSFKTTSNGTITQSATSTIHPNTHLPQTTNLKDSTPMPTTLSTTPNLVYTTRKGADSTHHLVSPASTSEKPKTTSRTTLIPTTIKTTSLLLSTLLTTTTKSARSTPTVQTTLKTSTGTVGCDKTPSMLGERYYNTLVPGWGELTYMCPNSKIFHPPSCECLLRSDIPTTTKSTTTKIVPSTTPKTTTTTLEITTTANILTTTPRVTSKETSKTTAAIETITPNQVCPLIESILGEEYFKIVLSTFGPIDMKCPENQKFDANKCGCYTI